MLAVPGAQVAVAFLQPLGAVWYQRLQRHASDRAHSCLIHCVNAFFLTEVSTPLQPFVACRNQMIVNRLYAAQIGAEMVTNQPLSELCHVLGWSRNGRRLGAIAAPVKPVLRPALTAKQREG